VLPHHHTYRFLYYAMAVLSISTMGGVILGWPSMRAILRHDGVLAEACALGATAGELCTDQELRFGLIYALASWSSQGGRFFVGVILDRFGPRLTTSVSTLIFAVGTVIAAMSLTSFQPSAAGAGGANASAFGMTVGFFLLGLGGAGVQLSLQSVSALFPKNRSLVMSSLTGASSATAHTLPIL